MLHLIGTSHLLDDETNEGVTGERYGQQQFAFTVAEARGRSAAIDVPDHRFGGELRLETELTSIVSENEVQISIRGSSRLFEGATEGTDDLEIELPIRQRITPGFATVHATTMRTAGARGGDAGKLMFLAAHDYENDWGMRGRTRFERPQDERERLISARIFAHRRVIGGYDDINAEALFTASTSVQRNSISETPFRLRETHRYLAGLAFHLRAVKLRQGEIAAVVDFSDTRSDGLVRHSDTWLAVVGGGGRFWSSTFRKSFGNLTIRGELYNTFPI